MTATVTDAPPTASPRTKRAAIITSVLGENVQPMVPARKMTASTIIILRRPLRSARRPPNRAPKAAPNSRDEVTRPSVSGVRPRSSCMYGRAPLITPVS